MAVSPTYLLQAPGLTGRELSRPRLALSDATGATEVWAAAGTGKTTLLAMWAAELSAAGETTVWVTIPAPGSPHLGLGALARASLARSGSLHQSRSHTPGRRVTLLIDDVHRLDRPEEGRWLADLMSSRPRDVRFVLAGRQQPQVLGPRTAETGSETIEYSTGDLAFTRAETAAFLASRGIYPASPDLDAFQERTGGWATAVALLSATYPGTGFSRLGVAATGPRPDGPSPHGLLTPKEQEILHELPSYQTVQNIAARRQLSPNTVKTHIRSVYQKLGVSSRSAAVAKAIEQGLL